MNTQLGIERTAPIVTWTLAVAVGCAVVTFVRVRNAIPPLHHGVLPVVVMIVIAVVEEAVFRRFLYRLLERFGVAVAISATSLLFALAHLPSYGTEVFAIDFAAGLLFGWQRYASGMWTAPAFTHAFANLVQLW